MSRARPTRRAFLKMSAAGAGALALVGCEDSGSSGRTTPTSSPDNIDVAPSPGGCNVRPGAVDFPRSALVASNADAADEAAVIATIRGAWERYLHVDGSGLRRHLTDDAVRMSGRWGAGRTQHGRDEIAGDLADEARAYERPNGILAEDHTISQAELWVDDTGTAATAVYWSTAHRGYRWCEGDQGLVVQALAKEDGRWRIAHWTDAFDSGFDLAAGEPGAETFKFDFTYPAADLSRAVDFYTPILGEPESRTPDQAVFLLYRGARFVVDASGLDGIADLTPGLPNGWAVVYVDDVAATIERLGREGVSFIGGEDLRWRGTDRYTIALDQPSDNPFVLLEQTPTPGPAPAPVRGFTRQDRGVEATRRIADAWSRADGAALDEAYQRDGRWFDETRVKSRGFERGRVSTALERVYWPRYDRSSRGLSVELTARDLASRAVGDRTLVSYTQELRGTGAHPFRETALVTHLLGADDRPLISFTVGSNRPDAGLVLGPDYIGYPTTTVVPDAERFYSHVMGFGRPYRDQAYRGWWSDNGTVYGTYAARPARDGLPRPGRPSAYNSFWVRSAREMYDYLERHGSTFPRIPAINEPGAVTHYGGYRQVTATDSEGNVALFTEYTGD